MNRPLFRFFFTLSFPLAKKMEEEPGRVGCFTKRKTILVLGKKLGQGLMPLRSFF